MSPERQGHQRLTILVPIKSVYATSTTTSVLSCPISEILQVFLWKQTLHPYSIPNLDLWLQMQRIQADAQSAKCGKNKTSNINIINVLSKPTKQTQTHTYISFNSHFSARPCLAVCPSYPEQCHTTDQNSWHTIPSHVLAMSPMSSSLSFHCYKLINTISLSSC